MPLVFHNWDFKLSEVGESSDVGGVEFGSDDQQLPPLRVAERLELSTVLSPCWLRGTSTAWAHWTAWTLGLGRTLERWITVELAKAVDNLCDKRVVRFEVDWLR